jgi:hypothetical protein
MRLIQISGRGRVGKSTLAHLIATHSLDLGYIPIILPFAKAIKDAAAKQGLTKESNSKEYREFCQKLGAEKRKDDPDYWAVRTFETIQEYMVKEIENRKAKKENFEYIVIQDDVRYMNEIRLGRELAATQIFIESGERKLEEEGADWRNHESEVLANEIEKSFGKPNSNYEDLFDVIITNDETLKDLDKLVKNNIEEWLELGYLELEFEDEETE